MGGKLYYFQLLLRMENKSLSCAITQIVKSKAFKIQSHRIFISIELINVHFSNETETPETETFFVFLKTKHSNPKQTH